MFTVLLLFVFCVFHMGRWISLWSVMVVCSGYTVKPVLNSHLKEDQKLVFMTDYRLLHVESIAEYFRPALG